MQQSILKPIYLPKDNPFPNNPLLSARYLMMLVNTSHFLIIYAYSEVIHESFSQPQWQKYQNKYFKYVIINGSTRMYFVAI